MAQYVDSILAKKKIVAQYGRSGCSGVSDYGENCFYACMCFRHFLLSGGVLHIDMIDGPACSLMTAFLKRKQYCIMLILTVTAF